MRSRCSATRVFKTHSRVDISSISNQTINTKGHPISQTVQAIDQDEIVGRVVSVIGTENIPAQLHVPEIGASAWTYVKDCLDTNWVSSVGAYVTKFEAMVAEFTGVRHAVATVNGTAALHVALQLCGVDYGSEVLMPSLTFIATANAVSYLGAIPHFVDVDERHLGVDAARLKNYLQDVVVLQNGMPVNRRTERRIAALVGMHAFGHPFDVEAIRDIGQQLQIPFVEDAAEGMGSYFGRTHVGNFGKLGVLSFNGNKIITTGGGGMILVNDDELARRAKHLTTTGKVPHPWEFFHDVVAYNYRLPNLNAALGCSQMEDLPRMLEAKRELASAYITAFAGTNVRVLTEPAGCHSNYWLNAIILGSGNFVEQRDELLGKLHGTGVLSRPLWKPMHQLPMYNDCPRMADLGVTESISARLINLPSSSNLRSQRDAR